jgi:c-di-GMP-binding flagellar brake protein YcgR
MLSLKSFQKSNAERRQFERLDSEEDFLIEFQKENAEAFRLGQGKDISEGGMRFATSAPVRKGEKIRLVLYLPKSFPGPRRVETEAAVRRVYHPGPMHRFRVACEFLGPQMSFHQAVTSYMGWSKSAGLPLR